MKVLLINGSPHKEGNTYLALKKCADVLHNEGIETEIFWIGNKPVRGCIGCGQCFKLKHCVFEDDNLNELFFGLHLIHHNNFLQQKSAGIHNP